MAASVISIKSVVSGSLLANKRVILTLKKRADFVRISRGAYRAMPSFVLQCHSRSIPLEGDSVRVGYTATRKVGNAIIRNRAKRRLRALAAHVFPAHSNAGYDYVLIARKDTTVSSDFRRMEEDLQKALSKVHQSMAQKSL